MKPSRIYVEVLDYDEDIHEELSGLGCSVAPGQDAPDSISYGMYTPAGQNSSTVQDYMFESQMLLELPEEGFAERVPYTPDIQLQRLRIYSIQAMR